jgi:hypothetical protein
VGRAREHGCCLEIGGGLITLPSALSIGNIASEVLQRKAQGKVMGVTSKGIFMLLEMNIVFITEANYRSPFNIIVNSIQLLTDHLKPGDQFRLEEGVIRFMSNKSLSLPFADTPIWVPDLPPFDNITQEERKKRSNSIRTTLYEMDHSKGWNFLAVDIDPENTPEKGRIRVLTLNFEESVMQLDIEKCRESVSKLLGLGGGLTPSGDDWITGYLLMKTRMKRSSGIQGGFLTILCREIIDLSFQKTTTISANRIQAASRGMSEELFLLVADSLINEGNILKPEIFKHLISFGHSSGVDTVMGITSAAII